MDIFLVMLGIAAVLIVVGIAGSQRKKNQNTVSSLAPEPTPIPLKDTPAAAKEQEQPVVPGVVIYADHIRIRSICPGCDGENDTGTVFCRICGERL